MFGMMGKEAAEARERFENTPISQLTVKEFRALMEQIIDDTARRQSYKEAQRRAHVQNMYGGPWQGGMPVG